MLRIISRRLGLALFLAYLAVFPGSTLTVALDRVPAWGQWMGGALLLAQGASVALWLAGSYGRRGALAAALVALLGWGVEHLGVTSGLPFGSYRYTDALQPQLLGVVPLAIPAAWLMAALGAWQLARRQAAADGWRAVAGAATLVLLLDLQIETVATKINAYWVWEARGPYYGVPTINFVAWWLVGAAMALVVARALPTQPDPRAEGQPSTGATATLIRRAWPHIPALLYLLSTLMFTVVNLARGYPLAGLVGLATLLWAAPRASAALRAPAAARAARRTAD